MFGATVQRPVQRSASARELTSSASPRRRRVQRRILVQTTPRHPATHHPGGSRAAPSGLEATACRPAQPPSTTRARPRHSILRTRRVRAAMGRARSSSMATPRTPALHVPTRPRVTTSPVRQRPRRPYRSLARGAMDRSRMRSPRPAVMRRKWSQREPWTPSKRRRVRPAPHLVRVPPELRASPARIRRRRAPTMGVRLRSSGQRRA